MVKNFIIAALAVCVLWLSVVVVRLENFHYASVVGMCPEFKADDPLQGFKRHQCLHAKETRTSPLWHVFYGLAGE
jgi:hypothetical protein